MELGGPPYLVPTVRRDKLYSLTDLLRHLRRDPALLAGAGAGPWPYLGVNCEVLLVRIQYLLIALYYVSLSLCVMSVQGIINVYVKDSAVSQGSHVVSVSPVGAPKGQSSFVQEKLPASETRTALLGNYLLSNGEPGMVRRFCNLLALCCGRQLGNNNRCSHSR